ncbi:MAG: adenylyltransferase/cytidyltransferase family protein, partial [Victivallaceae bacterium]
MEIMCENIEVMSCTALSAFGVKRAAYAVGVFDGVHLGHQKILDNLIRLAQQCSAEPVAVTFEPHPRTLLTPQNPPKLLMPTA